MKRLIAALVAATATIAGVVPVAPTIGAATAMTAAIPTPAADRRVLAAPGGAIGGRGAAVAAP